MKASIHHLIAAMMLFAAACGDSSHDEPEVLFVQTSEGARLTGARLTLISPSQWTGWFTDRPDREAGQISTEEFLTLWNERESVFADDPPDFADDPPDFADDPPDFADDPPHGDFSCTVEGEVVDYVVVLQDPALFPSGCSRDFCQPSRLTYEITFLGSETVAAGREIRCDDAGHLFIHTILSMTS